MKPEYESIELVDHEEAHRFQLTVDGQVAWMEYKKLGQKIKLIHTEVEPAIEGKGVATALIEKVLAWAETHQFTIIPLCSAVISYLQRHPAWKRVVDGHDRRNAEG